MPDPSSSTDDISDGAPAGSFCGRSSQDTLRWRRPFHMLEDRGTNAAPAAPAVARGWTPDSGLPARSPSSERRGMAAEGSPPTDDDAASACLACMAILSKDSVLSLRAPPNSGRCIPTLMATALPRKGETLYFDVHESNGGEGNGCRDRRVPGGASAGPRMLEQLGTFTSPRACGECDSLLPISCPA